MFVYMNKYIFCTGDSPKFQKFGSSLNLLHEMRIKLTFENFD